MQLSIIIPARNLAGKDSFAASVGHECKSEDLTPGSHVFIDPAPHFTFVTEG